LNIAKVSTAHHPDVHYSPYVLHQAETMHQLTTIPRIGLWLLTLSLLSALNSGAVWADVTPATDGTGTRVRRDANRIDIDGGTRSVDGRNLFHSFQQFGLTNNEIANFLSNPQIRNILGRVVGGDASVINGLIRVTGGSSNLYLLNPAGVIFGSNARLDVPGSFTVTTANGIGFGDRWLNVFGANDYATLVGDPSSFAFTMSQPGAIVNGGELSVAAGQSLSLLGGTVINTGTLAAPGGQITITAVPGENLVRISQAGMVLSLGIEPTPGLVNVPNPVPFNLLSLPQLLTVGSVSNSGLAVDATDAVRLAGSETVIPTDAGTAIASGTLDASCSGVTCTTATGVGGAVNVLGDRVALLNANINASGTNGGGTIRVGGDYQGQGTVPNASRTFVSRDSVINADALESGNGGRIITWSNDSTHFYGALTAQGGANGGNGGFAEVSGKGFLDFSGNANLSASTGQVGTLLLDPADIIIDSSSNPIVLPSGGGSQLLFADNPGGVSTINNSTINAALADVLLQATNTIIFNAPITITAANIGLTAQANNGISVNSNITTTGGNITLNADQDGINGGSLSILNGATVTTNGGNFVGTGAGTNLIPTGINMFAGSSIIVESGAITLTGQGGSTAEDNVGISLQGRSRLESSGVITLRGTGGTGESGGIGRNHGIQIADSTIEAKEGGSINLTGDARAAQSGNSNHGIQILGNTDTDRRDVIHIHSANGNISLTGTGGNSPSPNSGNVGVFLRGLGRVESTGDGNITLDGTGGAGGSAAGIQLGNVNLPATVRSVNGNIRFTGRTENGLGAGVALVVVDVLGEVAVGSLVESTGGGNVVLEGSSSGSYGVLIQGVATTGSGLSTVRATTGNLTIRDIVRDPESSEPLRSLLGIGIFNGVIESLGSGDISLRAAGASIRLSNGTINSSGERSGRVIFTTNEFNIDDEATQVRGSDILQIQPFSPDVGITVGGTLNDAQLNLNDNELSRIQSGFGEVIIGSSDSRSAITLGGDVEFNDPVRLQSNSINTAGRTIIGTENTTISLEANQDITTGNIINPGRAIRITSTNGSIDTRSGTLDTSAVTQGGEISLNAADQIQTGNLIFGSTTPGADSSALTVLAPSATVGSLFPNGGDLMFGAAANHIDIRFSGEVVTGGGSLTVYPDRSFTLPGRVVTDGGNVLIDSLGAVTITNPIATLGGDINLTGTRVTTTAAPLDSSNPSGRGGNISLTATATDISTGNLSSFGSRRGGAIALSAPRTVQTGDLVLGSTTPGLGGGALTVGASRIDLGGLTFNGAGLALGSSAEPANIRLSDDIRTGGGDVQLFLDRNFILNRTIATSGGEVTLESLGSLSLTRPINTDGGVITLGGTSIDTTSTRLDSSSSSIGGDITLAARTGAIATANLNSSGLDRGGAIALTARNSSISTRNLNSSGATGGSIFLEADTSITTGEINARGRVGDGGDVTLDPSGDVIVDFIDARGGNSGRGGDVDITAGRIFQARRAFGSPAASISTVGGQGGGDITIRHGGRGVTPFNIGNLAENGTVGAIASGNATISPVRSFDLSRTEGNIQIITPGAPVDPGVFNPTPEPPVIPEILEQSFTQSVDSTLPDDRFSILFENHLGLTPVPIKSLADIQSELLAIERETGVRPALIYITFAPRGAATSAEASEPNNAKAETPEPEALWHFGNSELGGGAVAQNQADASASQSGQPDDRLELVLVTPTGSPIRKLVPVTRREVMRAVSIFRARIAGRGENYLPQAQQLYTWLIQPLRAELQTQGIENLTFIMDEGLRSLPMAALHDAEAGEFLVQQYSMGLMPSMSLTDTRYVDIRTNRVLAMGTATFSNQTPLPAAGVEIQTIRNRWGGEALPDQAFTVENLRDQRRPDQPFGIVHLATHARFQRNSLSNSYIQFYDQQLTLDRLRELSLNNPPVELLVLSACETALGDKEAELGFAGLAVKSGVKTALASLWRASDTGTLGLMNEFYNQLRQVRIKSEALRQAQIAMINGQMRVENGAVLGAGEPIDLPPELANLRNQDFSHPYYWAAFTLIGSPW